MKRALIRVDATPAIGTGHLMRMVALGQTLSDHGYDVHFATLVTSSEASRPVTTGNFTLHRLPEQAAIGSVDDVMQLRALATRLAPDWVVLDGNDFDLPYQRTLKADGLRVMSVDDLARGHFVSDIVLNQNYGAERVAYSTAPGTRTLLGTRYVLLRREFREADPANRRPNEPPVNVLVSLGTSAVGQSAVRVLIAGLSEMSAPGLCFRVVVGGMDAEAEELRARSANPDGFEVVRHADHMAKEMSWADVAITSGGSTVWELMYMRVPFLAVALNEPQLEFLSLLQQDGLCVSLGSHRALEPAMLQRTVVSFLTQKALRDRLLSSSRGLVDPRSAERELLDALAIEGS
jgi:UDP-2,4-diacetamido-2,4,6-trideoxy-beta-L-altropyranose hydrolase